MNSLQFRGALNIGEEENINIESLIGALREGKVEVQILRYALEELQEEHTTGLCGERYERGRSGYKYKRAGGRMRTITTKIGKARFRLQKVENIETGGISTPFLEKLGLGKRKRHTRDLKKDCVKSVVKLTYRDASETVEDLTSVKVSKSQIHKFVREIGHEIEKSNQGEVKKDKVEYFTSDGTKAHGLKGKKNEINAVVGFDPETNEKKLLNVSVNKSWKHVGKKVDKLNVVKKDAVMVSDGEVAMKNALLKAGMRMQMRVRHAIGYVGYQLWQQGLPKDERKEIISEVKAVLYTLRNSVKKHINDKDYDRLEWRIKETLRRLNEIAKGLKKQGCYTAAKFIKNSANPLVTFARLVMKGVKIPYTNNLIERLMGEIAKRVKNRWAHWSTKGLQNMLNFLLVRYTSREGYNKFWDDYVYQNKFINIQLIIYREVEKF